MNFYFFCQYITTTPEEPEPEVLEGEVEDNIIMWNQEGLV